MFETLKNAFKNKDVRRKLLITLALLFIYRLGCWIPIPGINPTAFSSNTTDGLLGLLNGITGSALENGALFAIGITVYQCVHYFAVVDGRYPALAGIPKAGRRRKA